MSKINAADAIRASIRQNKALLDYADELEKIGSIEQAGQAAIAATNKARAELAEAKEQANKANEVLAQLNESARSKAIENEAIEKDWIEKAQADVLTLKSNAKERANRTLQESETKASQMIAGSQAKLVELQAALADTNKQLQEAEKAKLRAEEELAIIHAKIEQAKLLVSNVFN